MRLTAFRQGQADRMAVVLGDRLEPLATVEEFYADLPQSLEAAHRVTEGSVPLASVEEVPAVPARAKVLCVGINYRGHAEETGRDLPSHPNIFARWASTLVANGEEVPLPVGEPRLDYEAELVVVVGAEMHGVDSRGARAGILGYACGNDITAREYQLRTSQWALGKNADRSAPIGSLVTADEVGDLSGIGIRCRLNGTEVQASKLGLMIFSPEEVISYASGCLTLRPGDVIFTGTPEGVGFRRSPKLLMGDGDVVEVEIDRVGLLRNRIVARRP